MISLSQTGDNNAGCIHINVTFKSFSVAKWIEYPPGVLRAVGSNPVGNPRLLFPTLVTRCLSRFSH